MTAYGQKSSSSLPSQEILRQIDMVRRQAKTYQSKILKKVSNYKPDSKLFYTLIEKM